MYQSTLNQLRAVIHEETEIPLEDLPEDLILLETVLMKRGRSYSEPSTQVGCYDYRESNRYFSETRTVVGSCSEMEATELVMAFEEVFDIEIPDEDAKSFTTIKSIADYIVKKASDNNTPDSF
jgi:hypothetical protein